MSATPFYSRLSYSIGNEDSKTEQKALQIRPKDKVIAVTASGDRPLNLLFNQDCHILAIDANPAQNALCDLKMVSLTTLDYEKYLAFLGVTPSTHRLEIFQEIKKRLHPDSLHYWENHTRALEKGFLYQGAVERWLKRVSVGLSYLTGKNIRDLFACTTLEEQRSFIEAKWNPRVWKRALGFFLSPIFTRNFLKDPGLYAYVDPDLSISEYIHDNALHSLQNFPVKENIIISLICHGKVFAEGFSPYLTPEGVATIKKRHNQLTFTHQNIISYLENAEENSFDCYSFSDIASYMSEHDFHRLCHALYRTARPGARFCIRQFLSSHPLPAALTPHLNRDLALEASLRKEDRCFVYRFLAGTVVK